MREVLSLQYDASVDALIVNVAATKESEHVPGAMVRQLGVNEPQADFDLDELPIDHQVAFRALLTWLRDATEEKHAALAASAEAMTAKATALASAEHALKLREESARRELAALEAEIAAKREAAAKEVEALGAEIAAKRNEASQRM